MHAYQRSKHKYYIKVIISDGLPTTHQINLCMNVNEWTESVFWKFNEPRWYDHVHLQKGKPNFQTIFWGMFFKHTVT